MEHHPLDKACIEADKRVSDLLAALPAARIAEAARVRQISEGEGLPSHDEAVAHLLEHEPDGDGPLAAVYAQLIEAQAVQREAHIAWRDFLVRCQDS